MDHFQQRVVLLQTLKYWQAFGKPEKEFSIPRSQARKRRPSSCAAVSFMCRGKFHVAVVESQCLSFARAVPQSL
jgi:hypothetical protein